MILWDIWGSVELLQEEVPPKFRRWVRVLAGGILVTSGLGLYKTAPWLWHLILALQQSSSMWMPRVLDDVAFMCIGMAIGSLLKRSRHTEVSIKNSFEDPNAIIRVSPNIEYKGIIWRAMGKKNLIGTFDILHIESWCKSCGTYSVEFDSGGKKWVGCLVCDSAKVFRRAERIVVETAVKSIITSRFRTEPDSFKFA